jgi:nucleotide-binding universal stress UspA family protein
MHPHHIVTVFDEIHAPGLVLSTAFELADSLDQSHLHLLMIGSPALLGLPALIEPEDSLYEMVDLAAYIHDRCNPRKQLPALDSRVLHGYDTKQILALCRAVSASHLVVPHFRRSRLLHWLVRSFDQDLVDGAPCPVVVVPTHDVDPDFGLVVAPPVSSTDAILGSPF